jgi:glycine oxidase
MKTDYLIIGQGIAGSLIALELLDAGASIRIIDDGFKSSSTIVAAGLYNPVVFKRFAKSWMAESLIPFAKQRYEILEEQLQSKFHYNKSIYKVFASPEERSLWDKRKSQNEFMAEVVETVEGIAGVNAPFGMGRVPDAGNLDTLAFLEAAKFFFKNKGLLLEETFNLNTLKVEQEEVTYGMIKADKIIFCEGSKAVDNPHFNWLPFKLTKGEALTAKIKGYNSKDVINKGVFVLPVMEEVCRIGATYEWEDLSENPTEKGRAELIGKFEKLITAPFQVLEHKAGIRPTISDRRPIIGQHPEHPQLLIFNGMGTKGVLIAPYFAKHFANYLSGKSLSIHPEADIARFYKSYNS